MRNASRFALIAVAATFAGCTTVPTGPSTLALPGTTKGFEQFRHDDGSCRQYAYDAIGGQTATRAQEDSAVRSTIGGAVIGALLGGAVGGGHGAAVGAGVGGAAGGIAGVSAGEVSGYESQRRYDNAYTQCMYGKGHRVAVNGRLGPHASAQYAPSPQRYNYPPSPPAPGTAYAPPPPPGPGYALPRGGHVPPRGSAPGY